MATSNSALHQKLSDIAQLKSALAVLMYDREVFMPSKGSAPRADMLSFLAGELHERRRVHPLAVALGVTAFDLAVGSAFEVAEVQFA